MTLRLSGLSSFLLFQRALENRSTDMFRTSERLSTQKRINRPSDDPEGAKVILSFNESLDRIKQYERNIVTANRSLTQTEVVLNEVNDLMQRAKELAIQGNNGLLTSEARTVIAEEVQQLQQQLLQLANTEIAGQHIFAGYKTATTPFVLDANQPDADPVVTFNGDANLKSLTINESATIETTINGEELFMGDGGPDTVDLFQTLADLEVALRTDNLDEAAADGVPQMLENLDIGLQQVLNSVTSVGAKINRLDRTREQLQSQTETFKTFISELQDVDLAEIALEFQRSQTALQATIGSAGAVLGLPSLIDFIGR